MTLKKILGLLIGIIFIIGLHVGENIIFNNKNIYKLTNKTSGKVINYNVHMYYITRTHPGHKHYMTISYEVNGQIYENEIEYRGGKNKICNTGDTIDILYNPDNPKSIIPKSLAEWQKNNYKKSIIALIIIIIT